MVKCFGSCLNEGMYNISWYLSDIVSITFGLRMTGLSHVEIKLYIKRFKHLGQLPVKRHLVA